MRDGARAISGVMGVTSDGVGESGLSIRTKLIALIFAGVFVPLGASLAYSAWQEVHTLRNDLVTQSTLISRMMSDHTAAALSFEDRNNAEESLRTLSKHQDTMFAALYDANGVRFAQWHVAHAEAPERLERPTEPLVRGDTWLDTFQPVVRDEALLGTFYLRTSTETLDARTRQYLWSVAVVATLMGLFTLGFAFALQRVVSRPILRLSHAARQVRSEGNYSVRVQKLSNDEIGQLCDDFNAMVAQIASTQEELVRKERLAAVGELAAVMAHEVRNPLGVVFNSLEALKRRSSPSTEVHSLLEIVGEEADRLNRIVEDLLDFARPNPPARAPTGIDRVIASAVEVAECSVPQHQFHIQLRIDPHLPPVPIDERMIRQALINLLINALQAMPGGGSVVVSAAATELKGRTFAQVDVTDHGPGMSSETTERLFQPFFTTKASGTGLGLAVVRRFVEAHNGLVAVKSRKGDGSTFTLMLPLDTRPGPPN